MLKSTLNLILHPIVRVEEGEGLEEILDKEWEGVLEQIVGPLLKWDSEQSIEIGGISSLEFLGEGFVGIISHSCAFQGDSERSCH